MSAAPNPLWRLIFSILFAIAVGAYIHQTLRDQPGRGRAPTLHTQSVHLWRAEVVVRVAFGVTFMALAGFLGSDAVLDLAHRGGLPLAWLAWGGLLSVGSMFLLGLSASVLAAIRRARS